MSADSTRIGILLVWFFMLFFAWHASLATRNGRVQPAIVAGWRALASCLSVNGGFRPDPIPLYLAASAKRHVSTDGWSGSAAHR